MVKLRDHQCQTTGTGLSKDDRRIASCLNSYNQHVEPDYNLKYDCVFVDVGMYNSFCLLETGEVVPGVIFVY